MHLTAFDLISQSGLVIKFVLLILLMASVFSWTIIFMKHRMVRMARRQSHEFLNTFWHGQDLEGIYARSETLHRSPVAKVFRAGFKELKKLSEVDQKISSVKIENIERALARTSLSEVTSLEKSTGLLATVGSATPFIGLFGTVWGIMNAFQNIGATGSANLAVVAPGIAEALITTAAGLAAAIPAVIAYNYFVGRIKGLSTEMDTFSQDFLNLIQRSLIK